MERNTLENTEITLNTHESERCLGQVCTIHNRSDHPMRAFPQHWRGDRGIMERICTHGVGHPDPDDIKLFGPDGWIEGVHGCDGCCGGPTKISNHNFQKGIAMSEPYTPTEREMQGAWIMYRRLFDVADVKALEEAERFLAAHDKEVRADERAKWAAEPSSEHVEAFLQARADVYEQRIRADEREKVTDGYWYIDMVYGYLGPFESKDLALKVRTFVEVAMKPSTYAVVAHPAAAPHLAAAAIRGEGESK